MLATADECMLEAYSNLWHSIIILWRSLVRHYCRCFSPLFLYIVMKMAYGHLIHYSWYVFVILYFLYYAQPPMCISGVGSFPVWSPRCCKLDLNRDFLYLEFRQVYGWQEIHWHLHMSMCICQYVNASVHPLVHLSICLYVCGYICTSFGTSVYPLGHLCICHYVHRSAWCPYICILLPTFISGLHPYLLQGTSSHLITEVHNEPG